MFALLGAVTFLGAAVFASIVIVQMLRGYRPLIVAALNHDPMPRTVQTSPARVSSRRRGPSATFMPCRLEHDRAAA